MQLLYTKRKCRNHGFLLAFFGDFLSLLKESHPSETKEERAAGGTFLTQKGLLKESHPSETKEERAAGGTFLTQKGLLKESYPSYPPNTPSPSRIHCHRNIPERSHFHAQDLSQSQHPGV